MRAGRSRCSSASVLPAESVNAMTPANAHPMSAIRISTRTTRRCSARRISTITRFMRRPPRAPGAPIRRLPSARGTGPRGCVPRAADRSPSAALREHPRDTFGVGRCDRDANVTVARVRRRCRRGASATTPASRSSTFTSIASPAPADASTSRTVPCEHATAAAQDRDPIARVLDLGEDVARHEDRAALGRRAGAAARAPDGCRPGRDRSPARRGSAARGPSSSAAASPSRWRMPSEYFVTRSPARSASPTQPSTSSTRRVPMRSIAPSSRRFSRPRHRREERRRLDDRADAAASRRAARRGTGRPRSRMRPAVGRDESEQAADRRRLARAVRAEEPEHPAFGNREVEAVDRGHRRPTATAGTPCADLRSRSRSLVIAVHTRRRRRQAKPLARPCRRPRCGHLGARSPTESAHTLGTERPRASQLPRPCFVRGEVEPHLVIGVGVRRDRERPDRGPGSAVRRSGRGSCRGEGAHRTTVGGKPSTCRFTNDLPPCPPLTTT